MKPTMLEQALNLLDQFRPGDPAANAALIYRLAKLFAQAGEKTLVLRDDALRGGDCGSLNEHPAFQSILAAEEAKLAKKLAKMPHAPRIRYVKPKPSWVAAGPDPRLPFCGRPEEVFPRQVAALAKRLSVIGCRQVVIGISGGLDSALTLLVAVAAFDRLGFDRSGVHVYTMPGFGTTKRTRGNADLLCEGLGLELETIDITPACRRHFKDIRQPEGVHDVTFENTQARERTQILMDKANQLGGIVLGTGDMSEIALGWCTYNGDHMSMFGVNAGVPKTAVRDVCRWWAEHMAATKTGRKAAKALLDILATPVSPELLPAKNGEIAQKTEDRIGPYELHDYFLWHFVQGGEDRAALLKGARAVFKGQYDSATVRKWLDVFFRRLFTQAFKRNCAPDGVQVFPVYLSPAAWHVPGDISGSAFV